MMYSHLIIYPHIIQLHKVPLPYAFNEQQIQAVTQRRLERLSVLDHNIIFAGITGEVSLLF